MLGRRKVLAVIAARGGSKGLPRKNVLPCGGKPLIAWSVEAAAASRYLDRAVVSSDDPEILDVARTCGGDVPFSRPAELATDTATMDAVVLHAIDSVPGGWDIVVLLQATSPLRTAGDIDGALETFDRTGASTVVGVTTTKPPFWMYTLADERLQPLLPNAMEAAQRQAFPPTYVLNGAVYVADVAWLRANRRWVSADTAPFIMPPERSVDIDAELDRVVADALLRARANG